MNCYSHLTMDERESILVMREKGESLSNIAKSLNRSKSTISRELRRNGRPIAGYSACYAQKQYEKRRRTCVRSKRLTETSTREKVLELLEQYWSPEQICMRLNKEKSPIQIGTCTIYRGIRSGLLPKGIKKKLRSKPYHKPKGEGCQTGKLAVPNSIHERPSEANARQVVGHWESDSVQGSQRSGFIATHVDRKSRYLVAAKIPDSKTATYMKATIDALNGLPAKTFTTDNGKEFAGHEQLTRALGAQVYFCDPGMPGQKGTIENTNGLLRQFFPKRSRFDKVTQAQVDTAVRFLNLRPRKCLNWASPFEVFFHMSLHFT